MQWAWDQVGNETRRSRNRNSDNRTQVPTSNEHFQKENVIKVHTRFGTVYWGWPTISCPEWRMTVVPSLLIQQLLTMFLSQDSDSLQYLVIDDHQQHKYHEVVGPQQCTIHDCQSSHVVEVHRSILYSNKTVISHHIYNTASCPQTSSGMYIVSSPDLIRLVYSLVPRPHPARIKAIYVPDEVWGRD